MSTKPNEKENESMITHIKRKARKALKRLRRVMDDCARWWDAFCVKWNRHVDRMLNEHNYSRAVRDLVAAGIELLAPNKNAARFVADQLITAYTAVLLLLRSPKWRNGYGDYDGGPDELDGFKWA